MLLAFLSATLQAGPGLGAVHHAGSCLHTSKQSDALIMLPWNFPSASYPTDPSLLHMTSAWLRHPGGFVTEDGWFLFTAGSEIRAERPTTLMRTSKQKGPRGGWYGS